MKICKHYFSDDYEAEDCMMESLEKMFSNIDRFNGETEESFRCWVKRIVLNTCISKKCSNKRNIIPINEDTTMIESGDKPQSNMEYNDFINIVETLSEETREIFKMKEIIGMRYEEISNITGKTQSSIRMRVFRAKRELKEKLNKIYY
jgi:RNA polymerase sigma-70 factor (ECF subfamily)